MSARPETRKTIRRRAQRLARTRRTGSITLVAALIAALSIGTVPAAAAAGTPAPEVTGTATPDATPSATPDDTVTPEPEVSEPEVVETPEVEKTPGAEKEAPAEEAPTPEKSAPEGDESTAPAPQKRQADPEVAPFAVGPDGAQAPYVYWDVRDTAGNLVPGATFRIEYRNDHWWWGWRWESASGNPFSDCTAGGCSGLDRDADAGEFVLEHRGTPLNSGNRLATTQNYRVTPESAPAGYRWVSTASRSINSNANNASWSAGGGTYDFGTFELERQVHTITVKKGTYRTGLGASDISTENSVGVRFGLYRTQGSSTPDYVCEIEASAPGDCVFTDVAPTASTDYYVRELDPATGTPAAVHFSNIIPAFSTGTYELRTGTLQPNASSSVTIPGSASTSTSGRFANRAANPALSQTCSAGVRVGVLLDTSGSVGGYQNTLARATTALVDGLTGTPSSVAMFSFASTSPGGVANRANPQSVQTTTGANTVKGWYSTNNGQNANFTPTGGTNWDQGLWTVAQGSAIYDYDVVFVMTDGNPTYSGSGSGNGSTTTVRELERAVYSANALKKTGARVITVGIGNNLSDENLAAISGPTKFEEGMSLNEFDYIAAQWAQLEQVISEFAQGLNCEATITVEKQAKAHGSSDYAPAGEWDFGMEQSGAAGQSPASAQQETGANGRATWTLRFTSPADTASVTLTELERRADWTLADVQCTSSTAQVDLDAQSVELQVGIGSNVVCRFYNEQAPPAASVEATKTWVVSDGVSEVVRASIPAEDGDDPLPDGLTAQLKLSGPGTAGATDQAWGDPRDGYAAGATATIGEEAAVNGEILPGCVLTSQEITSINGVSLGDPISIATSAYSATLTQGENTFGITNTVTCKQNLTLIKNVEQPATAPATDAHATDWALTAADDTTTPVSGNGEATGAVASGVAYSLTEQLADSASQDARLFVPATEAWSCVATDDGPDLPTSTWTAAGVVTVPLGRDVECTVTNVTAQLTLLKYVDGGTGAPEDWNLDAQAADTTLPARDAVVGGWSGGNSASGAAQANIANTLAVKPGASYALSEVSNDPALAYLLDRIERWDDQAQAWVAVEDPSAISVAANGHEVYRFVNAPAPSIALPLTGGTASDLFLIVGGALLALMIALGVVHTWRRGRKTTA